MKSKNVKIKEVDSWALPGDPLNIDEFKTGIKDAEKGPFFTLEQLKRNIDEWKKNQNL